MELTNESESIRDQFPYNILQILYAKLGSPVDS
jgi:hypothetical protein